jgi:PAS domain S-box-containing protein
MSEQRVLLLASGPDADLGRSVLGQMGVEYADCVSLGAIAAELAERGAAAVLLTDEIATMPDLDRLAQTLREQPTWSDLPIVLLVRGGAESPVAIKLSSLLGNVSILDRPAGGTALTNALRTAIRARQRQYSLRDQNALNAAIVESSDDAIVTKSLDGTIRSWNGGAERLFGYTASEAIGRPITLIVPAHKQDEEVEILERLRRGERIDHFETTRVAKDGRELHISLSVSPLMDDHGRVFGASKVARDITSRKRTEAELRSQATQLRLLWESAAAFFATNRPESMLPGVFYRLAPHLSLDAYLNFVVREQSGGVGRLESWAGITDEEAEDIRQSAVARLDGDVRDERQATFASHVQRSDNDQWTLAKKLGFRSFICNPLIVDGALIGTLAFASRSKDEFAAGELELMRTICYYVTAAYARVSLIRRLRDTDRRKDEFLATLAHELRNPLAPIRNALEIMRVDGRDRSAVEDVAHKMIERQVAQMMRLVDDLLDVSRITTGRLELRRERIELAQVIRSAVETSRPLIDAAHHELSVELPSGPILLDADPVRLAQVFSNVLNNAARYMAEGGRIRVTADRDDQMVTVVVQDFGIGIAPDALPRIFDMFAQGDVSGEQSHGGLGIGLTLVKRLVEMHSGTVEASSEGRGRGTSISVRLPIAPAASAPLQPSKSDAGRRFNSTAHRILIADDNRDAAESMGMLLRLMGNDVRTVFDGVEAVEEAETFRPDLILLDIGMPKLNGHDAARRIREQGWSQGTTLVALTGWGREDDKRKAAEAGFDRHFTKPIDPATLQRLIADFRSS